MQGPSPPELATATDAAQSNPVEHRLRLIGAMAALLAERGYSTVTIADIARQAHVSKRTFYEHFADKDACFIACYETLSNMVLQSIVDAMSGDLPWAKSGAPRRRRTSRRSNRSPR